jgi:hypothetical protein
MRHDLPLAPGQPCLSPWPGVGLGPDGAATPADRLDHTGGQIAEARQRLGFPLSQAAQEAVVLVVAAPDSALIRHTGWLAQATRFVGVFADYDHAVALCAGAPDLPRLLIVDIDIFDNIASDIDRMIAFRRRLPGVAVVIASTDFTGHDFSVERAPVADVSLKLPVPRVALSLGLGVALTNMASRPAFHIPA